jgi:aryl-alcohol dehydrogenase-like predicted oxidoreductase
VSPVQFVELPHSGIRISRAALGTMTFGDQVDDAEAARMLEACAEAGVTLLDTANAYSNGASEETLGRLLRSFGDQFLIASKAGGYPSPDAPDLPPLSAGAVRAGVEGSLRRLGRDHLDIFFMHHPDPTTPILETVSEIATLIAEGKIRSYGVSNFASWRVAETIWTARKAELPTLEVSELMYNLLSRRMEDEYADYSAKEGLVNVIFNPLAGGLLTGKYSATRSATAGGRFSSEERGEMYRDRYWKDSVFAAIGRLSEIAAESDLTLIGLALRWLLSRPATGTVLVGASSSTQLRSNLAAIDEPGLDDAIIARCDEVWQTLRGDAPPYGH